MRKSIESVEDLLENASFVEWVAGKTARDSMYWEQWIKSNADKYELIDEARSLVKGLQFRKLPVEENQVENSLDLLNLRIDQSLQEKSKRTKKRWIRRLSAAAAVLLLLGFGGLLWYQQVESMVIHHTGYGEWKKVELPDGSTVKMNANSTLSYRRNWDEQVVRQVWLEGEAFFEVVKMLELDREFHVITSDLNVEVLGTTFNVKARSEETEVYLAEGMVKLNLGTQTTLLDPGDIISYSSRKQKVVDRQRIDHIETLPSAWNDGIIKMESAYAFSIFEKVEEIYGVTFKVRNEDIYNKQYYVALPMKELGTVIPILETSMKVKISRKDDILIVERQEKSGSSLQ